MLFLTKAGDLLQLVTASAVSVDVHASWIDLLDGVFTPGRTNTAPITGAATTTIVGSPAANTQRNVKHLSIRNTHASLPNLITVQHYDGTRTATLQQITLPAGYSYSYLSDAGWVLNDPEGARVSRLWLAP